MDQEFSETERASGLGPGVRAPQKLKQNLKLRFPVQNLGFMSIRAELWQYFCAKTQVKKINGS